MTLEINYQQLFVVCVLLFAEYILVLLAVVADLISGCRKAKKEENLEVHSGLEEPSIN
ncbi:MULTISPECIES: hypothetical protein [Dysgonomonas]|uniref:Uncharacterized protein n=1 Tax=Dysgonomonas gadei ATCC BAA-286 TaxID=742766 RepID=F5IXM1_9BACT|nr:MULTISPECIES: hypothetical protein [Dysgonomonas]EGK01690.1 hypothetical protein HMPREF9455_01838 [Dysgonomonas gadei ATCC BAA-286]